MLAVVKETKDVSNFLRTDTDIKGCRSEVERTVV